MSKILIEQENSDKNVSISGLNGESDVNVFRNNPDTFEDEDESELGMDYFTNDQSKPQESEIMYQESEDDILNRDISREDTQIDNDEEIQHKKAYYLSQLKRLEKKGHLSSRRFDICHPLEDIRGEVFRIKKEVSTDTGITYCKNAMMFCVNTIEMINGKFDPFGMTLTGWSNTIMSNSDSYDEVLEELYEKYSNSVSTGPEIKLIMMLGGSAFLYSMQKKMMEKTMDGFKSNNFGSHMKGPSLDTEELLRKIESDDDVSSVSSEEEHKKINIPKKRGRKPKIK